jgi:hypothetical protein
MRKFLGPAAALLLAGCYQVGSLEGSQVEPITVEGRKFEVRLTRTGAPNEWRMEINRATIVIGPEYETEYDRARVVAQRVIERTCKGQPYNQAIETMSGINYRTVFTCQGA